MGLINNIDKMLGRGLSKEMQSGSVVIFITYKTDKQKYEFCIPRLNRERMSVFFDNKMM